MSLVMANKHRKPIYAVTHTFVTSWPRETRFKVVLVGDADTGKTSVMLRLSHRNFTSVYVPTVRADFSVRIVSLDEILCKLQVWDTSGQDRFKRRQLYYRRAQRIVIFYDASRQSTFDNVPYWIPRSTLVPH